MRRKLMGLAALVLALSQARADDEKNSASLRKNICESTGIITADLDNDGLQDEVCFVRDPINSATEKQCFSLYSIIGKKHSEDAPSHMRGTSCTNSVPKALYLEDLDSDEVFDVVYVLYDVENKRYQIFVEFGKGDGTFKDKWCAGEFDELPIGLMFDKDFDHDGFKEIAFFGYKNSKNPDEKGWWFFVSNYKYKTIKAVERCTPE